jgi:hypothetical protein
MEVEKNKFGWFVKKLEAKKNKFGCLKQLRKELELLQASL